MEYALLQAVFLPLLLSPLAYFIGRRLGHTAATWFTFGLLLYCTILIIAASVGETYEEHYPWTELFGEFGFLLDGLAAPFAIMFMFCVQYLHYTLNLTCCTSFMNFSSSKHQKLSIKVTEQH